MADQDTQVVSGEGAGHGVTTNAAVQASTRSRARTQEQQKFDAAWEGAAASLGAMFLDRVASSPQLEAYQKPDGNGGWQRFSWGETGEVVTELAAGLLALGLSAEDRVAIAATTRLEWIQADLAIMCAGGATTTIYPTSTPEDVHHILTDSGSRFAVLEDAGQVEKAFAQASGVEKAVLVDGDPGDDERLVGWDQLRELGREHLAQHPDAVTAATAAVQPEHLATLIYTSGTTGRPKGVRLTHRSWVYEGISATDPISLISSSDLQYLWLPLSHSFGKVLLSAQLAVGHSMAVDGRVDQIIVNLPVVRPTVMAGAPRIFEKVYAGVVAAVRHEGGVKLKLFDWAVGVGRRVSKLQQEGKQPSGLLAAQHRLADKLVLSKVRARFGGRIRYFISGSAPLSGDISSWFHAVGLLVLEGYGLTETSAGTFVNRIDHYEFGTVGLPMPGTEVSLAEDGEVLVRGPGVMAGYRNLEQATAETITEGGWLHTGDIGEITAKGSLRITDRKKDLIKTSGGKYVAPQSIETQFKALCPLAAQIVVHGDGRHYVTALIGLDPDAVNAWAERNGKAGQSFGELASSPELRAEIEGHVEKLNGTLGRWETIKKFAIIDRELTVEDGDLTPSLKLKRRAVESRYKDTLDGLYSD